MWNIHYGRIRERGGYVANHSGPSIRDVNLSKFRFGDLRI